MTKYKQPTTDTLQANWERIFNALNGLDELSSVVATASYIDHSLGALLHAHFIKSDQVKNLLKHGGAVGHLMAKANLAYCLGLITKEWRQNIEAICDIRNLFAHSIEPMSFSHPEIQSLCQNLEFTVTVPNGEQVLLPGYPAPAFTMASECRKAFQIVSLFLCVAVSTVAAHVTECKKQASGFMFVAVHEDIDPEDRLSALGYAMHRAREYTVAKNQHLAPTEDDGH